MNNKHIKYNTGLAKYFSSKPFYLDREEKKPQIRKAAEQPYQQTRAEMWGEVVDTLCDLLFIEAKCRAGLTFDLVKDYKFAYRGLPEAQPEIEEEKKRQERIDRWTKEIIEYSSKWNERHDKKRRGEPITEPEPVLPEPPRTVRIWTDEEIEADTKRIIENPTRLDKLKAFESFVKAETYPLHNYSYMPGFVIQHAHNFALCYPIKKSVLNKIENCNSPVLLRVWPNSSTNNFYPSIISSLKDPMDGIKNVKISANGRWAISGCKKEKKISVWDLKTGQCHQVIKSHDGSICSLSITLDGGKILAGGTDNVVRLWDLKSGRCLYELHGHNANIFAVDITPDGSRGISGSWDHRVRIWDLDKGICLAELIGHKAAIISVAISSDGRLGVSGCGYDQTLRVWDLENYICRYVLVGHTQYVTSVHMTPNGKLAVSGSDDNTIRVWDLTIGQCVRVFKGHTNEINNVNITPDGNLVFSGSCDNTLRIWDIKNDKCFRVLYDPDSYTKSISSSIDGRYVLSVSSDESIKLWDIEKGTSQNIFYIQNGVTKIVNVSDIEESAIVGNWDNTLRCWEMRSAHTPTTICTEYFIEKIDSSWDGIYTVLPGPGNRICVLNLKTGEIVKEIVTPSSTITNISASEDISLAAVTEYLSKSINVYSLANDQILFTLIGHTDNVNCVCVTGDGRRLVSGADDKTIRIWELDKGLCLKVLNDRESPKYVSVSFDGSCIVTGNRFNNNLRVWDFNSKTCIHELIGHTDRIENVKVTTDGLYAASSSWDKTLRLWDLKYGKCLSILYVGRSITSIGFSKNNKYCVVGTHTGEVLFYELKI